MIARIDWQVDDTMRRDALVRAEAALATLESTPFAVAAEHMDEIRAWVRKHDG